MIYTDGAFQLDHPFGKGVFSPTSLCGYKRQRQRLLLLQNLWVCTLQASVYSVSVALKGFRFSLCGEWRQKKEKGDLKEKGVVSYMAHLSYGEVSEAGIYASIYMSMYMIISTTKCTLAVRSAYEGVTSLFTMAVGL